MEIAVEELKDDIKCNDIEIMEPCYAPTVHCLPGRISIKCAISGNIEQSIIEKLINTDEINEIKIQNVEYNVDEDKTFFTASIGRELKI